MTRLVLTLVLGLAAAVGCKEQATPAAAPSPAAAVHADEHHAAAAPAEEDHHAAGQMAAVAVAGSPPRLADGGPPNVVQAEMQLLTVAMNTAVNGIGAMDVRGVGPALHRVHQAKDATAAALKSRGYTLPKNPDRVAEFVALDEAFHANLVNLVRASAANDVPATATALGKTLEGCVPCHTAFRKP